MSTLQEYLLQQRNAQKEREAEMRRRSATLIAWCDAKALEGELAFAWEGGNDSGWAWLELDGRQLEEGNDPVIQLLVARWEGILEYGSWAGDFDADGRAPYDPETKTFRGTDTNSCGETIASHMPLVLELPAHVPFDSLSVNVDGRTATLRAQLRNGPFSEEDQQALKAAEERLQECLEGIWEAMALNHDVAESQWLDENLPRAEFTAGADGMLRHTEPNAGVYCHEHRRRELALCLREEEEEEDETEL